MNVVYVVEIVALLLLLIIEIIGFTKKSPKKTFIAVLITIVLAGGAFIVTYILEKPVIDLKDFTNIEVKSELKNPNTIYHFKDITKEVKIKGDIDTEKVGEYNITLEVPMYIGKYEKEVTVKVVDTKAPKLTLKGETNIQLSDIDSYKEEGYEAVDENEGDLTEKVEVSKEEIETDIYNLIYKVSDSSGNVEEKKRHVVIVDNVPPEINLNGNHNIYLNLNNQYEELGATVIDKKDGDVSDTLTIDGSVDTSKEGVYIITYSAKDKTGNEATTNRYVLVSREGTVIPQDGSTGKKGVIYLTFDDGPSTNTTPKILDILDKKGVKATFFIINYDPGSEREELVKREHEAGHAVAIHGYSHTYSQIYQSNETYMNNITKLQEKIKNTIGIDVKITRFPGGSSNTISRHYSQGIMTRMCYELVSKGYTYFDWNVDSDDAGSAKSSDDVYRNVTNGLKKDRANVVLMHDFSGNTKTLNALESIIDFGLQNGYTFETITEETQMVTHKTNN